MAAGSHRATSRESRFILVLTAVTLTLAFLLGGGQGSAGETLLAIIGLLLIVIAVVRQATSQGDTDRLRWFWLLPALLIALPVLQLLPLPAFLWTSLPGRASLVRDLATAGVEPGLGHWTLTPLETERVLWFALVPAGVFMAAAVLRGAERRLLVALTLGFAAINAFLGLWQLLEGPGSPLYLYEITNRGEAVGLFANRNHLAGFLAASLPVAVGTLADRLRNHPLGVRDLYVWVLTILIVLLGVTVTATHSRAGFLMLMLSVVACAFIVGRLGRSGALASSLPWLRLGALLAGVLIVQFTLYGVLQRLDTDPLDDHRWAMNSNTLAVSASAFGAGFGLGSFRHAYDDVGDAAADIPEYVNHAHDDYAELWLEAGLPAVLLAIAAVVAVVAQVRKYLRASNGTENGEGTHRGVKLGAAFALLLLLLHSLVDYPLRTLAIASYAALLAAVLLGSVRISGRKRPA